MAMAECQKWNGIAIAYNKYLQLGDASAPMAVT